MGVTTIFSSYRTLVKYEHQTLLSLSPQTPQQPSFKVSCCVQKEPVWNWEEQVSVRNQLKVTVCTSLISKLCSRKRWRDDHCVYRSRRPFDVSTVQDARLFHCVFWRVWYKLAGMPRSQVNNTCHESRPKTRLPAVHLWAPVQLLFLSRGVEHFPAKHYDVSVKLTFDLFLIKLSVILKPITTKPLPGDASLVLLVLFLILYFSLFHFSVIVCSVHTFICIILISRPLCHCIPVCISFVCAVISLHEVFVNCSLF